MKAASNWFEFTYFYSFGVLSKSDWRLKHVRLFILLGHCLNTKRFAALYYYFKSWADHCNIFFNISILVEIKTVWSNHGQPQTWGFWNPSVFHGFIMVLTNPNAEFITSQPPPAPPAPPWHGSLPHPLGWHRPMPPGRCSRHSKCGLPRLAMGMVTGEWEWNGRNWCYYYYYYYYYYFICGLEV